MDIVTGTVAGFHGKILGDRLLESGRLNADGVVTDRKQREVVLAGSVGLRSSFLVGPEIYKGNRGVGHDGARCIRDGAEDVRGGQLPEGSGGKGEERQYNESLHPLLDDRMRTLSQVTALFGFHFASHGSQPQNSVFIHCNRQSLWGV